MIYLGVNTGTSADAVDVVICEHHQDKQSFIGGYEFPLDASLRAEIMDAVHDPSVSHKCLQALSAKLGKVYQEAIRLACEQANLPLQKVRAIGLHGQTIHHCPDATPPYTIQLDQAADVANALGVNVIAQFRASDIAAGGQGAPLIPAYHHYLAQANQQRSAAFINLGGIANITWFCDQQRSVRGWDIGPANALLDAWVHKHQGKAYDDAGEWARSGRVDLDLLDRLCHDEYFGKPTPKSTGRDYFNLDWLAKYVRHESPQDIQATLVQLTVTQTANALQQCPWKCQEPTVFLYGKGVANAFLYQKLVTACQGMHIQKTDKLGMPPQWLEGGLFAWLAFCYEQGIAQQLQSITGANQPCVLGACYPATKLEKA